MKPSIHSILRLVDEDDDFDCQAGTLTACLDSLWTHVPPSDQQKAFDDLWVIVGDRLGMNDEEMKEILGVEAEESQEEAQEEAQGTTVNGIRWSNVNVGETLWTNYPNYLTPNSFLYPVTVEGIRFTRTASESHILVSVMGHDCWLDASWFHRTA